MLFQADLSGSGPEECRTLFWNSSDQVRDEVRNYANQLFHRSLSSRDRVDELIRSHAQNWSIERMAAVDRNILRLAIAELLMGETPATVVIDEAIEIARKFGTEKSPEFVNGILDSIRIELERSPHEHSDRPH